MNNEQITVTQVQGLHATELIAKFESIESKLAELQNTVKPPEEIELITRADVAQLLGISYPTLHKWIKNGILIAYRIGNKVRFKKHEVLEALTTIKANKAI